jgi:hypothetical protein
MSYGGIEDRFMLSYSPEAEIEEHIRKEFQSAVDELERAASNQKVHAEARLKRVMRRLYDFVGYGRIPQDLQFRRTAGS